MPVPQTTLPTAQLELIKEAKEKSFFFQHRVFSHIRENTVYLYDSFQPKIINSTLAEQLCALYGDWIVKVPQVQLQKESKDCGCFATAFCVSLMFRDHPATLYKETRKHLIQCFEAKCFTAYDMKSRTGI